MKFYEAEFCHEDFTFKCKKWWIKLICLWFSCLRQKKDSCVLTGDPGDSEEQSIRFYGSNVW